MASAQAFTWTIAPDQQLIPNIKAYGDKVWAAIGELADYFSAVLERYAKQIAPFTDRTGAARASIRSFVTKEATRVVLWLVGGVSYFIYLEIGTRHSRPYPTILPTLEAHHAPIMAALRQLVA
jgi:hypothetical protein